MKVVIIGGVAGGLTVARKLRRDNKEIDIVVIDKSYHLGISTCFLPYAIFNDVDTKELAVDDIKEFEKKLDIEVKLMNKVIDINTEKKELKILETGTDSVYNMNYDKLVIATGTDAVKLKELSDIYNNNIFILKNIKHLEKIREFVKRETQGTVTIVGANMLGLEIASEFLNHGYNVNVVELKEKVLPKYSKNISQRVYEYVDKLNQDKSHKNTINIYTNTKIKKAENIKIDSPDLNYPMKITLDNNKTIETDAIIVAAGVRPNTDFLKNSDIELDSKGYILTNDYFETNIKDVYALGDVIPKRDYITSRLKHINLAGVTQRQARIVGENILGNKVKSSGVIRTEIFEFANYTIGRVGLSLNEAKFHFGENNVKVVKITERNKHGLYSKIKNIPPEKARIDIVAYFTKDNQLVGAEAIGTEGVDKRLDVLATAIKAKFTAQDLIDLDLTYSPPYSIPKDIINRLGSLAIRKDTNQ